jgi:tetrapyrrole methylase family protein/MazG family protein
VLVPAQTDITGLERYDFGHLNQIIRRLCAPDGCPWDRVQTHESLRTCLLEEAYEVIDAIDEDDPDHLYDELGDLLMQVESICWSIDF